MVPKNKNINEIPDLEFIEKVLYSDNLKCKLAIIYILAMEKKQWNELFVLLESFNIDIINRIIIDLEQKNIIKKELYSSFPIIIEYELTNLGFEIYKYLHYIF